MSLSILNEHREVSDDYRRKMDAGWAQVRVALAVGEQFGPEQLSAYYTAVGTRIHVHHQDLARETILAALADRAFFGPVFSPRPKGEEAGGSSTVP